MKKAPILLLIVLTTLFSCESDSDSRVEPVDAVALATARIHANQQLLDQAYILLGKEITKDTILLEKSAAGNLSVFVRTMSNRAANVFAKALDNHLEGKSGVHVAVGDVKGYCDRDRQVGLLTSDLPIEEYKKLLQNDAKEMSAQINKWLILKTYEDDSGTTDMPSESFSLNFTKIEFALALSDILVDVTKTDKQIEEEIKELAIQSGLPEILIALLLPAVQKARENHMNEKFLLWLATAVESAVGSPLDRDIIRRIVAAEFQGGMELFIGQDYNKNNQDQASFNIMKARFETALTFLWGEVWTK